VNDSDASRITTSDPRVSASRDQLSTRIGKETVILHLPSGHYYGLRDAGTRIWELILGGTTREAIVATLQREYDVGEDRCRPDVDRFLADLRETGLVEPADGTGR
jgi:hypothetical protein